jgi:hypothetical protein
MSRFSARVQPRKRPEGGENPEILRALRPVCSAFVAF